MFAPSRMAPVAPQTRLQLETRSTSAALMTGLRAGVCQFRSPSAGNRVQYGGRELSDQSLR